MRKRKKYQKTLPPLSFYREAIIVMMRHGKAVDRIAQDLGYPERVVVNYIKDEGLDRKLYRRSWKWKSNTQRRRIVAGYNSSREIP